MTTHLSVRLAWHDNGWDGRICKAPHLNAYCIAHEHIRDARNDDKERKSAGEALADLDGWLPPCSRDPGAFAPRGFRLRHEDPLEFRKLPTVEEYIPAYSACPAPYRWMLEEHFRDICEAEDLSIPSSPRNRDGGWVQEPERQIALLDYFWGKLSLGSSLVFFYSNQGNPLDEQSARVVVGVGRLSDIGSQLYFGQHPRHPGEFPVWSRCITHNYPTEGLRLPYQEYLANGHPTDKIIVRTPRSAFLPFSYGTEHVSDDVALAILDRLIQSVDQIRIDGIVSGDWDARLEWLNNALAEVWRGRGPFPGIGSVLEALGMTKGTAYHRTELAKLADNGENPWEHVRTILDGSIPPPSGLYAEGLLEARRRWQLLPERQDVLSTLARFELSSDQVRRIIDPDQRKKAGIEQNNVRLVENPYLICERDAGLGDSPPIALETIDHGMRPEGIAAQFMESVAADDRRRIRAVGVEVLSDAAQAGDTLLPLDEFFDRVRSRFPDRRICPVDRELFQAELSFFKHTFAVDYDHQPPVIALSELEAFEQEIKLLVTRRASRSNQGNDFDWQLALRELFGKSSGDRDDRAREEKVSALGILNKQRLSLLTGGAGTGKTSVVRVLLDALERRDGHHNVLLLAPTGKARVRLGTATNRETRTIHQFLLRQEWIDPRTMNLLDEGRAPYQAHTVIVDECSMIPTNLLGTLFRALDSNRMTRLILIGDPNQLPPIGPGRPFADILTWLEREHPECVATLHTSMRADDVGGSAGESRALLLAEGYRAGGGGPGDDEVLSEVAQGISLDDLDVVFWNGHDDLIQKIQGRLRADLNVNPGDYEAFNRSLGMNSKINRGWNRSGAEAWQLLAPTRRQFFGTDNLNRIIQREFRGGLIKGSRSSRNIHRFGDEEIVYTDKVIQIRNQRREAWPRTSGGRNYVANGEIGVVAATSDKSLDVFFSTQDSHSYRYFGNNDVNGSLELGYALTVHKAQGSDFNKVFLVIPRKAGTLSRELLYTALTRFKQKLVLLLEGDIETLVRLRRQDESETRRRRTGLFAVDLSGGGPRPGTDWSSAEYMPEQLKHKGPGGMLLRSKSEVIIAQVFEGLGISYNYEEPLRSPTNQDDFRLPDFTVSFEGDVYYWEHLGMLAIPSYQEQWQRKRDWYRANGYLPQLITSEDSSDGAIDVESIKETAHRRIVNGESAT